MIRQITWTDRGVLESATLYGPVMCIDGGGGSDIAKVKLCRELERKGLLRDMGGRTFAITDAGREWAVWGNRKP